MTSQLPIIAHQSFAQAYSEVECALSDLTGRGGIVPLVGPPGCGQSALVQALFGRLANRKTALKTDLFDEKEVLDWGVETLRPAPSETDLLRTIVKACGGICSDNETSSLLTTRIIALIAQRGIKVLVIEDFNKFCCTSSLSNFVTAMGFLKLFSEKTAVTFLITGAHELDTQITENALISGYSKPSIEFLPYRWDDNDDFEAFAGCIQQAFNLLLKEGFEVEVDLEEVVWRLYGAASGRIGIVFNILHTVAKRCTRSRKLTTKDVLVGGRATVRPQLDGADFFRLEDQDDIELLKAYRSCMHASGAPVPFDSSNMLKAALGARG